MPASEGSIAPRRRWVRRLTRACLIVVVVWLVGDFCYSQYVAYRIRQWETAVPWTSEGRTPDADETTRGSGEPALLLVHGFSDTPQIFRKLVPELVQRGYTCRAILLPGFGRNVEAYRRSTHQQWLDKLSQEVAELRKTHDQVWVVAHSLGGAISINYQLNHPGELSGLVLITPAVQVSSRRSPVLSTRFWHEFSKVMLPFSTVACSPFAMDARDPAEREREYRNVFTPRSVVDNTFRLIDANAGRADEIQVPSLFFLAVEDPVVDSPAIEGFFNACGAADKELVRLDNSGHMAPVDLQWPLIVEELDEFVSAHSERTEPRAASQE